MYMYYLLGHRLMELPISVDRKEVLAENTYILTLDGDIDFQPPAVRCVVYTCLHNTICFIYIIHSFIYLLYLPMYIIIYKILQLVGGFDEKEQKSWSSLWTNSSSW